MPAIALTFLYLIYLSLICQTLVIHDSIGYLNRGQELMTKSFFTFLSDGPQREPLYSFFVSWSFQLAIWLKTDALFVLKIFQITALTVSQVFSYFILKQLHVRPLARIMALGYMGISPVLVNSAFWVYSEILIIPFMLLSVLAVSRAWRQIEETQSYPKIILTATLAGLTLSTCVFVKNIFELISPCLLTLFLIQALTCFKNHQKSKALRCLIIFITALCVFYVPILGYKYLNYKHNGHFTFTTRAAFALTGNTLRRSQPLSALHLQAALAYAVNSHFCYAHLDAARCDFWSYKMSDQMGSDQWLALSAKGMTQDQIDAESLHQSITAIIKQPFQHAFLTCIETGKMLFWETSKAGQVFYPQWLDKIYKNNFFDAALLILMAVFSLCALMILAGHARQNPTALILLTLIVLYALAHGFFFVLHRYTIPLAPLWIISIAFGADQMFKRR